MVERDDEVFERAVAVLSELPQARPGIVDGIVSAAAQARLDDTVSHDEDALPARRSHPGSPRDRARAFSMRTVAAIAAAAAIVGFVARDVVVRQRTPVTSPSADEAPVASGNLRTVAASVDLSGSAPVPTQFVLENDSAAAVAVVGDFNGWDVQQTRLTREPGSNLWSVTLPITPGRHVYAFIVNDTVWTPDPRAPRAQDDDFGVPGSVVIVGRP